MPKGSWGMPELVCELVAGPDRRRLGTDQDLEPAFTPVEQAGADSLFLFVLLMLYATALSIWSSLGGRVCPPCANSVTLRAMEG